MTGIWSEDEIIDGFIKSSRILYYKIRDTIVEKFNKELVLGRKTIGKMHELSFHVGSRLIIVLFSDDIVLGERRIESVFIDRRPIVF